MLHGVEIGEVDEREVGMPGLEEVLRRLGARGLKSVDEIRSKHLEYGYALDSEGLDEAR